METGIALEMKIDCKCMLYLIESVLSAVADVHKLNDLSLESLVEHVGL